MKRYFALGLALLVLATGGVRAQGSDDDYVQIYSLIQEADALNNGSSQSQALAKYLEAQAALQRFHKLSPDWNSRIFNFRLNYVTDKIADLRAKAPTPAAATSIAPAPAVTTPVVAEKTAGPSSPAPVSKPTPLARPETTELENQLNTVKNQVHLLQMDRQVLEAKLKEALSAQPAAVDPRELARAEQRVKSLEKENDLLKVTMGQEKIKAAPSDTRTTQPAPVAATQTPPPDTKAMSEARLALAEANRKLADQTQKANGLAQEKQFLESKLTQLSPGPENAAALDSTRNELAEAKRTLAEQTQKANGLAQEKQSLEKKLAQMSSSPDNAAALASAKKALVEANHQLAEQKELVGKLGSEKQALQGQVRLSSAQSQMLNALRAENTLLKKRAAEAKTASASGGKSKDNRQLAEARAQLAALESERDVLRVERLALENRLKEMAEAGPGEAVATTAPQVVTNIVVLTNTLVVTNFVAAPVPKPEEPARLKALERERDDLEKKLNAANKELNSRKSQAAAARVTELEGQLAALKARVDVFEARQVPFSAEELAQFNQPVPKPAETDATQVSKPAKRMPREELALVAEAQRYFANHQLDKAEDTYVQVLQKDQTNVIALANLATIQLENNRLESAETNILQALMLAPDDAYSLSILGYLRYRQRQYDAALDALGRAAKFDPQNAQVQNYLGITLAEKGLRGPAETAFRKAIQIEPNYGDAHVNLALIYVSQKPPANELARWHYQRALTAGHAHEAYLEKTLEINK